MPKKPLSDKENVPPPTGNRRMRFTKPKSINELLSKGPVLKRLVSSASQQDEWLEWLAARLTDPLRHHLCGAQPKGSELLVYVDAAVWSERARQQLVALLPEMRARDGALNAVRVRVQPR